MAGRIPRLIPVCIMTSMFSHWLRCHWQKLVSDLFVCSVGIPSPWICLLSGCCINKSVAWWNNDPSGVCNSNQSWDVLLKENNRHWSSSGINGTRCFHCNINSFAPSGAVVHQWSWSKLVKVMPCFQATPSHYLNQCWLIMNKFQMKTAYFLWIYMYFDISLIKFWTFQWD